MHNARYNFLCLFTIFFFTIRVVADDERPFALGIQATIGRIFGSIPGPLLFGAVYDAACIKWQDACGHRGNCWIYDTEKLSYGALYFAIPCVLVAAVLSLFACIFHPKEEEVQSQSVMLESVDNGED